MALQVKVRQGGAVGATTLDFTAQVPVWDQDSSPLLTAGMMAANGAATQFEFIVDDDPNDMPVYGSAHMAARNVVTIIEDTTGSNIWLARGRIATSETWRREVEHGVAVGHKAKVEDGNVDLRGIVATGKWERPEETGAERAIALMEGFCQGSPRRLTTNIDTHLVDAPTSNTLPAWTYPRGTMVTEIMDDIIAGDGKMYAVVIHHDGGSHLCLLYTGETNHSTYPCTLSITDTSPDLSTSYPPIWDQGPATMRDGQGVASAVLSKYGMGETSFVESEDATLIDKFDDWMIVNNDAIAQTEERAQLRADNLLLYRGEEHITHPVTIKLRADKCALLCAGMSIDMRSAAALGGENLGDTLTRRIVELKWEPIAPEVGAVDGWYYAHMQLDRPLRVIPERREIMPKPPTQPTEGACTRLYFSTDAASVSPLAADTSWANDSSIGVHRLKTAPDDTIPVGSGSSDIFVGVNVAAGSYLRDGGLNAFQITDAALLASVQAGGMSARAQLPARSRNGIGISEASQDNYPTWVARVYRAGTGFIGTMWSLTGGGTKFVAQSTFINRAWQATSSAVGSAALNDWIIFEFGSRHVGPTSGGTGAYIRLASDTSVGDLPEDELETTTLNAWVDICSSGSAGDSTTPVVNPGEESPGTDNDTYSPIDHSHAHGFLADDGTHMHDADQIDGVTSGSASLPWFNVQDYGALEDGATDAQTAVNDAIADLNAAGGGQLYFPGTGAGYVTTGAFTSITVPAIVRGDGNATSIIKSSSATAFMFTSASDEVQYRDLWLENTHSTPTAGAAIRATSGSVARYHNLVIRGGWIGIRQEAGATWSMDHLYIDTVRKYGIHISNSSNPDEGDWSIANSTISAIGHSPDAAIRIDSSGGGKITNLKVNASVAATGFNHGIDVAIAGSDSTAILLVANSSIENLRGGDALHMTQTGTASWTSVVMAACQVSLPGNTGRAVSLVAEDAAGLSKIVISSNVFTTGGTAREAVAITNVDQITFVANEITDNYTSLYTATTSTNITEITAGVTDHGALTGLTDDDHTQYLKETDVAAKGDLYAASANDTVGVLSVGTNGQVLTAASGETLGVKWETPSSSGGIGEILIADEHSTPLIFADLLQNDDGDNLLYTET